MRARRCAWLRMWRSCWRARRARMSRGWRSSYDLSATSPLNTAWATPQSRNLTEAGLFPKHPAAAHKQHQKNCGKQNSRYEVHWNGRTLNIEGKPHEDCPGRAKNQEVPPWALLRELVFRFNAFVGLDGVSPVQPVFIAFAGNGAQAGLPLADGSRGAGDGKRAENHDDRSA